MKYIGWLVILLFLFPLITVRWSWSCRNCDFREVNESTSKFLKVWTPCRYCGMTPLKAAFKRNKK